MDRPAYITPNSNKNQVQEITIRSKLHRNTVIFKGGVDFVAIEYRGLTPVLDCCSSDTATGFLGVEVPPA